MDDHSRVRGPLSSRVLRTHLEFEAQRLDVDVETRECWTNDIRPFAFEPHALVCVRRVGEETNFAVPVPNSDATVTLPVTLPALSDEHLITLQSEESEHPLAAVVGRELHVFVDFGELFADPDAVELDGDIEQLQAIRRIFEAVVPGGLELVCKNVEQYGYDREREAFARMKLAGWEDRYQQWQTDLRYNESDLDSACRQVERLSRACAELRQKITAYEEHTRVELRSQAAREFDQLRNMTPEPFTGISLDNGTLKIQTCPVVLEHDGRMYEMGRFEIQVRLSDFRLRIKPFEDNRFVDEYFHPHLSAGEGIPCWGTAAPIASQLIGERELSGLLPLIWSFLTSYNEENPYLPVARWSPDYDPNHVFEECFEDAHPYFDCSACTRRQCPFNDTRFDRCWDHIGADENWRRCIDCDRCHHSSEARERLSEQQEQAENATT